MSWICIGLLIITVTILLPESVTSTATDFYLTNTMTQQTEIVDHEEVDEEYLQGVEDQILQLLGLPDAPRTVGAKNLNKKAAPKFMMHLYQEMQKAGGLEYDLPTPAPTAADLGPEMRNTSRSATHKDTLIDSSDVVISFLNKVGQNKIGIEHEEDRRLYFELTDVSSNSSNLNDAELRIYKKVSHHSEGNCFLSLFRLDSPHNERQDDFGLTFIDTIMVNGSYEGWLVFNMSETLNLWLEKKSENNGVLLQVMSISGDDILPHKIGIANRHADDDKQGFLVALFKSPEVLVNRLPQMRKPKTPRRKRSVSSNVDSNYWETPNDGNKYPRNLCQRRQLYVHFQRLGYDTWIIAPPGYPAFYCEGECSFPLHAHMNATNHAIVQTLVSLINPNKFPKACCAPKTLTGITVLYYDNKYNVILKKYPNMIVQTCGCH